MRDPVSCLPLVRFGLEGGPRFGSLWGLWCVQRHIFHLSVHTHMHVHARTCTL